MTISFDKRADALYLAFSGAKSVKTIEIGNALIDFDSSGFISFHCVSVSFTGWALSIYNLSIVWMVYVWQILERF